MLLKILVLLLCRRLMFAPHVSLIKDKFSLLYQACCMFKCLFIQFDWHKLNLLFQSRSGRPSCTHCTKYMAYVALCQVFILSHPLLLRNKNIFSLENMLYENFQHPLTGSLKEGLLKQDSRLRYSLDGAKRESCSERAGISLCLCCNTALSWSKGERIAAMFSVGQGRGCPPRSISASLPARV